MRKLALHFDFNMVFKQIAKFASKKMVDKSFEETKRIVDSTNRNEPVQRNESELAFSGEYFMNFVEEGEGPHDV
jgi:hypothetical protein